MSEQFNVDLPSRFRYIETEQRKRDEELEEYLNKFTIQTDEMFKRLFNRLVIPICPDFLITTTTATTVASTTLWTGCIGAKKLIAGRVYKAEGCGFYNTHDAGDHPHIVVAVGATPLISLSFPAGNITNKLWCFNVLFTVRTVGATGTISTHGDIEAAAGTTYNTVESVAINTTTANDITVKCVWDAADADNWVKLTQCYMRAIS